MPLSGTPTSVAATLAEEFAPLGDITTKPMFGGAGVFCDGVMFTLIDRSGAVFLRSDDTTDHLFEAAGSHKHGMPYWLVPESVLAESDDLLVWAERARDVAMANKK